MPPSKELGLISASTANRYCIFCGATADSREHLLPEWLQQVFPSKELAIYHRTVGGEKKTWETKRFSQTAKVVCESCNHGWMSRLENEAKPILTPAIARVEPCAFDLRSQWIAAQWAAKTCFVMQRQTPEPVAPSTHPFLVRANGRPPPQMSIFVGSHYRALRDPASSIYIQKPISLEIDQDGTQQVFEFGYLAFLAVGGISFLIVGHRLGSYVELVLGEHQAELFTKIWPWTQKAVHWPPELLMDQELLETFFLDNHPPALDVRVFQDFMSQVLVSQPD